MADIDPQINEKLKILDTKCLQRIIDGRTDPIIWPTELVEAWLEKSIRLEMYEASTILKRELDSRNHVRPITD